MEQGQLNWVANFIWGIADDVLRDLYVRGKYRDVILPMTVLRRLDAVLEPTKQAVLDMKASLDKAGITNQDQALRQAAGQAFYNTSKFTLRDLKARASQQQLKADFEAYLDGFSPNECCVRPEHKALRHSEESADFEKSLTMAAEPCYIACALKRQPQDMAPRLIRRRRRGGATDVTIRWGSLRRPHRTAARQAARRSSRLPSHF